MPSLSIGSEAPDFFARGDDGRGLWLKALRGRPVVLCFLADRTHIPEGLAGFEDLRSLGAEVIVVLAAPGPDVRGERVPCPFPIVADEDGQVVRTYGAHKGTGLVIDEVGTIVHGVEGQESARRIAADAASFLRARQSATPPPPPTGRATMGSIASREGLVVAERFRLKRLVGKGGNGEVWLAEHLHLKRDVALKILTDPPVGADDGWVEGCVRRFRFEAQVSAMLGERTRHVVRVYDAGHDEVGPFLAMEFIEGRALDQEIEATGPLTPKALGEVLDQIGEALTLAHEAGIIHRDLKPANVMMMRSTDGKAFAKLTDFGIAKATSDGLGFDRPGETAITDLVGTPEYMSPEQLRGLGTPGPAIDVWALGVVVYEALTGRVPFDAAHIPDLIVQIVREAHRPISALRPDLPAKLDAWMSVALAKEAEARFSSVAEAVRAYHDALRESERAPTIAPTIVARRTSTNPTMQLDRKVLDDHESPAPIASSPSRTTPAVRVAAIAIALGIGITTMVALHYSRESPAAPADAGAGIATTLSTAGVPVTPSIPSESAAPPEAPSESATTVPSGSSRAATRSRSPKTDHAVTAPTAPAVPRTRSPKSPKPAGSDQSSIF